MANSLLLLFARQNYHDFCAFERKAAKLLLNIDKFKVAQKQIEETAKKFKPIADYKNNLKFTSLPYELEGASKDSLLKEKRERWHESLSKDIYVEEALNVLDDLQPKSIVKTGIPIDKKGKLVKS